ncbi:hypothetical protein QTL97_09165 [Sporosarcina thermotolerans]|uniref:Uncharacterized protein n=2 Tax=Sporosarcina TaxID=1569 RepID=A0ABT8JQ65_9BACL|nr:MULTISPECIES: hypothetical protein [Sporosarcina]MDN4606943.1 hypothetical protein [Sporosarcina highlanderae]MDW0117104.1 hypothetical protein [Sporosarcina thermotolerans]WHT47804.1 hypothetical protein QNH10_17140 [Sporosarcina thermotolerans]
MIGFWIVAVVMCVPIVAIITEHREKTLRYKTELVREELELEKLKQQNFIIETEKMKLELEQMKLDYTSDKNDVMKA